MKTFDVIPINELPEYYQIKPDPNEFMRHAADYLIRYVRARFHCSSDMAADFYIFFYDRVNPCLVAYQRYADLPFIKFFTVYIRNDFRNFIKQQRLHELQTVISPPQLMAAHTISDPTRLNMMQSDSRTARIWRTVARLPGGESLPFKLYYAGELNLQDLQFLLELLQEPERAHQFIQDFHRRRQKRALQMERLRRRLDIIHAQLESYDSGLRNNIDLFHTRQQRWKERLLRIVHGLRGLYSFDELGNLMQVSKSTVARRLEKVRRHIKGENECKPYKQEKQTYQNREIH